MHKVTGYHVTVSEFINEEEDVHVRLDVTKASQFAGTDYDDVKDLPDRHILFVQTKGGHRPTILTEGQAQALFSLLGEALHYLNQENGGSNGKEL